MRTKSTRRRFIQGAAAGTVALTFPIRRVLGANEAINLAFIGLGGRGASHCKWFSEISDVRVAGLCDVDSKIMGNQKKLWETAKTADDMRVDVTIGVPKPEAVDKRAVLETLPHGSGHINVVHGGLQVLNEKGDDGWLIANAIIVVSLEDGN